MICSLDKEFGSIRSFLWPIHAHERRKLVPLLLMIFLIAFDYSLLKCMKDAVVVTASGAEVIPFIKVWVLFPTAILLTYLFSKLSNHFSQEKVIYMMISGFLAFFLLFAFILYPWRDFFHPNGSADYLEQILPLGLKGMIAMYRNWTFTAFYVISELWGSIIFSVIFWGFVNEITKVNEARRFYGVLGVGSNIAAFVAGQMANLFSQGTVYNASIPFGSDPWEQTMMLLVLAIVISGAVAMMIFYWMNKNVLSDPAFEELHQGGVSIQVKKKKRLSLRQSIAFLSNSRYLFHIAVLVVAYNLTMNLVEVVWKDQLRELCPSPSAYNLYMNNLTSSIGLVSTIMAFFIAVILDRYGWTKTALITPVMMLITGAGFFGFLMMDNPSASSFAFFGATPLAIAVFFGGVQNCLCKAMKYSVFDVTKEMTFIPLDHDYKLKGKAAIDGVGSRFGKSGSSLIHQGLFMLTGSLTASLPIVGMLLFAAVGGWIYSVGRLGYLFKEMTASQGEEPVESVELQASTTSV